MPDDLKYKIALDADVSGADRTTSALAGVNSALRSLAAWGGGAVLARQLSTLAAVGVRWQAGMEDARRGLAAVMGSAQAAGARLQELNDLEGLTGFDAIQLAAVSRQLQIMTGGALASGQGLRLVADVSAALTSPLEVVADALGRVYGQIKAGSPELGRGLMQLTMMGAISSTTSERISELAKSGGDAWGALSAELLRFSGAGAAALDTFNGRVRQLRNTLEQALGSGAGPIFGALRDELGKLNAAFEADGLTPALQRIGRQAADTLAPMLKLLSGLATSPAVLTTAATALMAYVQILAVRGVVNLAAFTAGVVRNTVANNANTAAMQREAAAAAALASHVRGGAQAFSQAQAKMSLMQQALRSQSGDSFGTRSTSFVQRTQAEVDAIVGMMGSGGAKAGNAFSRAMARTMKMPSASQMGSAAMLGVQLGLMAKSFIEGKTAEGNAQIDAAADLQDQYDDINSALQERIDKLETVAEKEELLKSLESDMSKIQREQGKRSRYGKLERGVMDGQLSQLRIFRTKTERAPVEERESAKAMEEAKRQAQAAAERIRNAGMDMNYAGDPLAQRVGESETAWLQRKLSHAEYLAKSSREALASANEKANSGAATAMDAAIAEDAAATLRKSMDLAQELRLQMSRLTEPKEGAMAEAQSPADKMDPMRASAGVAETMTDRLARIGGFVGGAAQDLGRRTAVAAEASARYLAALVEQGRMGREMVYA